MTEKDILSLISEAESSLSRQFSVSERIEQANFEKVMDAFAKERVAIRHFAGSTGYGYGDDGRDTLEKVFADVFHCEDALVRPAIASGTHALALCLYGLLRNGDTLLAGSGKPYDTLESVIGISGEDGQGSLKDYGVSYKQIDLKDNRIDIPAIADALQDKSIKVVALQRSRGYDWRPSISVTELGEAAQAIHAVRPDVAVMVDNCYGEFVEEKEPTDVGCDIIVGSLIKNLGGGIAPTGGYIAGKAELVEKVSYRLTSPGIGREVGSYIGGYDRFFEGLFFAPHVVCQAIKGAMLTSAIFEKLGYAVSPASEEVRHDIIQAIRLGSREKLIGFCEAIQYASPVDSFVTPEPWAMPGYQDEVIMAAGTFVGGASIELSADAPLKEPFHVYMQGGLTYSHVRFAMKKVLQRLSDKNLL